MIDCSNDRKSETLTLFCCPTIGLYRIPELTYGGPDSETRQMLDLLTDEVEGIARRKHQITDPRNPVPGTQLIAGVIREVYAPREIETAE